MSVPVAALGVSLLVLRGGFKRVEHMLLALSAVFIAYGRARNRRRPRIMGAHALGPAGNAAAIAMIAIAMCVGALAVLSVK